MASYLTGVDPQSFQISGYQLPVNQIIQAVATRNAYWDTYASQLKNAYSRNLNLNLTLDQNKQQLQSLMKGVDAGLQQAVRSDLSLAPNANEAMKIFDPITQNQNIQGDNAITNHYQRELQLADSYRTKDGGKEYSPVNVKDLMIGLDRFAKSGDPNSWKEHYATRRSYTPYYDVQSEINQLRKTFKPNITTVTKPSIDEKTGKPTGFYLQTVTDKSSYENQWKAYLATNLSDKARQQLAINGRVSYYEQPGALARDYADYTQNKITGLAKEREVTNGIAAAITDPQLKSLYNEKISQLDDDINDLRQERDRLRAGDLSTISNNQDAIASLVYSDNYISNVARSLQNIDTEVSFKPDAAAINFFNQNLETQRFNRALASKERIAAANLEMRARELAAKVKGEGGVEWNPSQPIPSDESDNTTLNKELYDKQVDTYKSNLDSAVSSLDEYIRASGYDMSKMKSLGREAFLNTWITEGSNKQSRAYQNYKTAYEMYNNAKQTRDQIVAEATETTKRLYPELYNDKEKLLNTNSFAANASDGTTKSVNITDKMIRDSVIGIDDSLKLSKDLSGKYTVTYKDKTGAIYTFPDFEEARIISAITSVQNKHGSAIDKVKEAIESSITQSYSIQKPEGDQYKDPKLIASRQDFQREFGLSKDVMNDVTVYGRNQFGMYYNLPTSIAKDKLGVDREKLEQMVIRRGGRKIASQGNDIYFVPYESTAAGGAGVYLHPSLRPVQAYFDYKKAKATTTGGVVVSAPSGVNYDPNNIGEAFSFMMEDYNGVPTYIGIHKDTKKKIGPPQGFESLEAAQRYLDITFQTKKEFDQKIVNY
jgi:hypothetical protein